MNILLTTSAAPAQAPFSTTEKRPPLGIGFLISVLKNNGHRVFFIDNYLKPYDFINNDYLQKNRIDLVGIYANTICFRDTLRMCWNLEYLRQQKKWSGKIVIGGPHTTVAPETIPYFVDHIIQGEGEKAILDIVEGKIQTRIVRSSRIKELDRLPMPAWDYFVKLPYHWHVDWFPQQPVFTMNTSRGCPFNCSFCSVGSIWGKRYTYFSAERIIEEIKFLKKDYGASGIYFREDNFTINRKRLIRFCELMLAENINVPWACETRVNSLDEEIVKLMARAGVCGFYFGVESGSQKILNDLNKNITVDQIIKAFDLCKKYRIKTAASIIVGTPTETKDDLKKTFELIDVIKPTVTWYNVFVGIPNSKLHQYCKRNNLYEFIDDRGLGYLYGHNERVKRFYGGQINAKIPIAIESHSDKRKVVSPEISVIMSVYNQEEYVEEAINSILQQDFLNFEFIIVDDASTDQTRNKLKQFKDPRIKIFRNSQNRGLTKSLNKALKLASADIVARMDGDDVSLPYRLSTQFNFLKAHPEIALVGSSYYIIDKKNKIISTVKVPTSPDEISVVLSEQNCFGHGTVMFRKESILKVGGYDENYSYAQDYDLWLRLEKEFKIANIKKPLYLWRANENGISFRNQKEQKICAERAQKTHRIRRINQKHHHKDKPLVSVIIPTFNRPKMLMEAIDSVLAQSLDDFEIIIVNDAGKLVENSIINRDPRNRISYIRHNLNKGLAAARNTGLLLAKGKYICYLDDDDIFLPNHLEILVSELEKGKFKVVYSDAYQALQVKEGDSYKVLRRDIPYSIDFDRDFLLKKNIAPVNCFMHVKKCVEKAGLFDEKLNVHEDWDFWIRLSRHFDFKHIPQVTCEFRVRTDGSSMTAQKRRDFFTSALTIFERNRKYYDNNPHIVNEQLKLLRSLKNELKICHNVQNHLSNKNVHNSESIATPEQIEAFFKKKRTSAENTNIWANEAENWSKFPVISIYVIMVNSSSESLADTLDSLAVQIYGKWKLTVISDQECISPIFKEHQELSWVHTKNVNHWVTINNLVPKDHCDWLLFLTSGDRLTPHCFSSLVNVENNLNKDFKFIYFDHEINGDDKSLQHMFKPDLNNDLLRSEDYIQGAFFVKKEAFQEINGIDNNLKFAELYDLTLRVLDNITPDDIYHISDTLLTKRKETETLQEETKLKEIASKLAIQNHLNRNYLNAKVVDGNISGTFRCVYDYKNEPFVSIIIPTKNQIVLLRRCIESIFAKTIYKNYEIIIVDNKSDDQEAMAYLKKLQENYSDKIRILSYNKVFNYSDANNLAAQAAKGEYLLFLNNDTEIIQENWLNILISYCKREEVGAVGARLLFPNGTIQHAGIIVGLEGMAEHPFLGAQIDEPGYMNRLQVDQNYSAVTAACMLVKRKAFEDVKGFDQKHYQLNFSDVDFCLKLGKAGYKIIWTPHVTLIHHTSITQKKEAEDPEKAKQAKEQFEKDKQALVDLWFPVLCNDPAYNYNLSLGSRQFDIDITENPGWPSAIYNLPRIWAFPRAKDGAGEYRVRRPLAALQNQGLALTHAAELLLVPNALLRHRPTTIIFQTPTADEGLDYLKQIRKYHDGLLIYEIDDLLHHIPFKNPAFQNLRGQNLKKKIKEGVNYCDRMIVSTRPLADAYEGFCKDIRIVPNYISKAVWGEVKSKKRNGSKPRVGWAGGAFHYGDLMVIKDVVKDLANEVDWIFMGMCPDEIRPYVAEYHEGVDIDKYPAKLASLDLDLALAPLEINAFNKAKSNLRLLEYGILAWPVIATDILPYQDAPVTLVKNKYRDWLRTIKAKIADPLALEREGEKLQKWVMENWILEDHLEEILLAYV